MGREIIGKLREIVNEVEQEYENMAKPKHIYNTLKQIVEEYSSDPMHSSLTGYLRNKGVKEICKQLKKLQKELTFQDNYKINYIKK